MNATSLYRQRAARGVSGERPAQQCAAATPYRLTDLFIWTKEALTKLRNQRFDSFTAKNKNLRAAGKFCHVWKSLIYVTQSFLFVPIGS